MQEKLTHFLTLLHENTTFTYHIIGKNKGRSQ